MHETHEPFPTTRKKVEVLPRTESQKTYIQTVHRSDITFAVGSAGTGKTHLAGLLAMWYLTEGHVDRIIICRPAVEAGGEQLGHLPGKLEEKMDPFIRPVYDAFETYWHRQAIERRISDGTIEIVPLAFMRGRTFKRAFIIADEMQNADVDQLRMLTSRLGQDSKMVITGDPTQSDINGHSCFRVAEEILGGIPEISFVHFQPWETVRHPTVKKLLKAWKGFDTKRAEDALSEAA